MSDLVWDTCGHGLECFRLKNTSPLIAHTWYLARSRLYHTYDAHTSSSYIRSFFLFFIFITLFVSFPCCRSSLYIPPFALSSRSRRTDISFLSLVCFRLSVKKKIWGSVFLIFWDFGHGTEDAPLDGRCLCLLFSLPDIVEFFFIYTSMNFNTSYRFSVLARKVPDL